MDTPTHNIRQKKGLSTVLIIDDDPMMRLLMSESLQQSAFHVVEAESGDEGLRLFHDLHPQVILVDLQMPGMDGFTFCNSVRATPGGQDTPIIVVTGLDDEGSIERAYDCGATDFIIKPVHWPMLHHRVQYILRSSIAMQSARQNSNLLAEAQRIAKLGNWTWNTANNELYVSEESYRIFGVPRVAPGVFHKLLINSVHPDDKQAFDIAVSKATSGQAADIAFKACLPNKQEKTILMHLDSSNEEQHTAARIFGTFQDISEQRRAEESIRQLAYYDNVTGLANRGLFKEHLNMALHQARRNHENIAVMFIDLDNFKPVNDCLGHDAGDLLLQVISKRLQESVRSSDMAARDVPGMDTSLARLGGDEFTVMLSGLKGCDHISIVARRILDRINEPVMLAGSRVIISASIGIAIYPDDGDDIESLLRNADAAMYQVKAHGRNSIYFYDDSLRQQSHDKLQLTSELHKALELDQMRLFYQPKVDVHSQKLLGFEALIRWIHPEKGLIPPFSFIPAAEESGLIIPIGKWVIRAACLQHQAWRQQGHKPVSIAVNLSAHQFGDAQLLPAIREIMSETDMPPEYLEVEITESVLMQDANKALNILNEMKAMGLKISIDDFGTGYSSISYLKHFPVDVLKIDREFVKDLPGDEQDATITNAIIMLAKALGLTLVAEGVETVEQLHWLRDRDCDQIQGYYFSPPVPADKATVMLDTPFAIDG